jgi:hypothetical protein
MNGRDGTSRQPLEWSGNRWDEKHPSILSGQASKVATLPPRLLTTGRESEDFIWPEDPLFCLACATTVHFIDSFTQSVYNPIAFKQQKENAPAEWSFSSFEEQDEDDPADWWKTLS